MRQRKEVGYRDDTAGTVSEFQSMCRNDSKAEYEKYI